MKKIFLLSISALLLTGAFAQKGNNGKNGKNKEKKEYKQKQKNNRSDDDDRYANRNREDGSWNPNGNRNRDDDRYQNQNGNNGKYSKNAPAKVREAFNNEYPNASNVSWTKDRGYWTAHFGGGLFSSGRTATYKANGQRVETNNNGGIFGDRDRTNTDNRTRTNKGRRLPDIVNGN